jgi:hypothetical protein
MKLLSRAVLRIRLQLGDVWAILLALVMMAAIFAALLVVPMGMRSFGFGPQWGCIWPGKGEPVCVKSETKN